MTVEQSTGAVSRETESWHAIDWQKANRNVRRLQVRIVKATKESRWGKVKALQRLLTRSYSAKVLAVKRVTENTGKRTPGVDGETWNTPAKKMAGVRSLRQRGYRPQPLRRIYIPKSSDKTKKRPLSIPIMKDRAMQALHLMALDPVAEATADPNSYGFRKERSPADAIGQCFIVLSRKFSPQWILEGDIKSCFDKISHTWLETNILMEKVILRKWLKAGYMDQNVLYPTAEGVPQGGIASPVIANMTLDGLETLLQERYPKTTRLGKKSKVNLVRFADDWAITGSSRELLEEDIKPLVETFLRERGLALSQEKTHITHINDGFDFLGQNIRKYRGTLLIKPAKKSVKRLMEKVRMILSTNKQAPAGLVIVKLNPILRGWAQYHRHVASKETFSWVDYAVYKAIYRWTRRRHSNKNWRWIREKYFKTVGRRKWVFYGDHDGKERRLFSVARVLIKRHTKIRGQANPYDPEWEIYFEERLGAKMYDDLQGRKQLLHLWEEQNGICPICGTKITLASGWHNHHIVWRSKGGPDTADNRVLLHPNCHRKVHSQRLHVEKPRPVRGVNEA